MADRNEYNRKWRQENHEHFLELNRAWYRREGKNHYRKNAQRHKADRDKWYERKVGLTRSEIMARIKSVSKVEIAARRAVTEMAGCVLRHQPSGIFGKPDYANKARKIAIFVDGCWWHMCPEHFKMPKTNTEFWSKKFHRNVERRGEVRERLEAEGYRIISIWEHDLVKGAVDKAAIHRRVTGMVQ